MSFFQALVAEQESKDSGGASIAEQVLSIMEIILDEANAEISEDKVRLWAKVYSELNNVHNINNKS